VRHRARCLSHRVKLMSESELHAFFHGSERGVLRCTIPRATDHRHSAAPSCNGERSVSTDLSRSSDAPSLPFADDVVVCFSGGGAQALSSRRITISRSTWMPPMSRTSRTRRSRRSSRRRYGRSAHPSRVPAGGFEASFSVLTVFSRFCVCVSPDLRNVLVVHAVAAGPGGDGAQSHSRERRRLEQDRARGQSAQERVAVQRDGWR
jgi:hypothetical protein